MLPSDVVAHGHPALAEAGVFKKPASATSDYERDQGMTTGGLVHHQLHGVEVVRLPLGNRSSAESERVRALLTHESRRLRIVPNCDQTVACTITPEAPGPSAFGRCQTIGTLAVAPPVSMAVAAFTWAVWAAPVI